MRIKYVPGWDNKDTLNFFSSKRNSYKHLYKSEKYFLTKKFITSINSVLDVGSSVGGFYNIFYFLNNKVKYTGLDTSAAAILKAKKKFKGNKNVEFYSYDGFSKFPLKKNKYDLVFCSGLMHLIDNYKKIITQMIASSKKFLLVDFRITTNQSYSGKHYFRYSNKQKSENSINYHVLNIKELLDYLKSFKKISKIYAYGYKAKPSSMASGINEVFMIFFKLELSIRKTKRIDIIFENQELKKIFS